MSDETTAGENGDVNVEGDAQVVVNNDEDGGGVDNVSDENSNDDEG